MNPVCPDCPVEPDPIEIDITGTMTKPVANWQERVDKWCRPEFFVAHVEFIHTADFSTEEQERLERKLRLVERAAQLMAAGMLKGTLKYPSDDTPLATWMAHLVGEGADQMNYQMLTLDAFERGNNG